MNKRTALLTPVLCAGMAVAAVAAEAAERTYEMSGFTGVSAGSGLTVEITVGPDFGVSAKADRDRHLNRLTIERSGQTLVVSRKKSWSGFSLFRSEPKVIVRVEMPEIGAVDASAGSSVTVTGDLDAPLELQASSGAALLARGVDEVAVSLTASSGASARLEGRCDVLSLHASSGASVNARQLECDQVSAHVSSGSSASAYASQAVEARASSGASLSIHGNPETRDGESSSGASLSFR